MGHRTGFLLMAAALAAACSSGHTTVDVTILPHEYRVGDLAVERSGRPSSLRWCGGGRTRSTSTRAYRHHRRGSLSSTANSKPS